MTDIDLDMRGNVDVPPARPHGRDDERGPPQPRATQSRAPQPRRDHHARDAASRHSRRVRRLKIVLPIAGVVVALVVAGVVAFRALLPGVNMPGVLFTKDGLTMVEPRLTGRAKNRAYDVTAAKAYQSLDNPKLVTLEKIDGRIEMPDQTWAKIEAKHGRYDGNLQKLVLDQGLTVTTSTGYRIEGEFANIDLDSGRMASDRPVTIDGPSGRIEAGGVEVADEGHDIRFVGGVRMNLIPAPAPAAPQAGQEPSQPAADPGIQSGAGAAQPTANPR